MTSHANCSVGISAPTARPFGETLPDSLRSAGWERVDLLDEVDSTNTFAAVTATPRHLVAARQQTAGRGRLGRRWESPLDAGVMMSVTLPLPEDTQLWGWMPLLVGDAARRAIRTLLPDLDVWVKWPNDLVVRREAGDYPVEKLAGILCQVVPAEGQDGSRPLMVAGIGLNVSHTKQQLPIANATSLALEVSEETPGRDAVLLALADELGKLASDVEDNGRCNAAPASRATNVRSSHNVTGDNVVSRDVKSVFISSALAQRQQSVRDFCITIGAPIEVHTPDAQVHITRAVGVAADGQLLTRASECADVESYSVADIVHAKVS